MRLLWELADKYRERAVFIIYEDFQKYDAENMAALPVLYQSGYLTISDYDEGRNCFTLDYPPEEVRASFAGSLAERYLRVGAECRQSLAVKLADLCSGGTRERR
ncbi:MAG: hypothetical protein LBH51_06375 [Treponema sp.]|jgi:hypothetical protein|nr:hypothetical protein [Treponema sp.]